MRVLIGQQLLNLQLKTASYPHPTAAVGYLPLEAVPLVAQHGPKRTGREIGAGCVDPGMFSKRTKLKLSTHLSGIVRIPAGSPTKRE